MLVVALDTTSRSGSHALVRDGDVLAQGVGDAGLAHAERLPGEIVSLLSRQGLSLADVDVFAVAAGPGSFTGLRIGIASMQGLAFATGRPVVGVSALDALARTALATLTPVTAHVGVWMDGQRGEVFAALYAVRQNPSAAVIFEVDDPAFVADPADVIARWADRGVVDAVFVGDGAIRYRHAITEAAGLASAVADPVPPIATEVAALAAHRIREGGTFHPHAVVPIYVRRPDVELARDRQTRPHD